MLPDVYAAVVDDFEEPLGELPGSDEERLQTCTPDVGLEDEATEEIADDAAEYTIPSKEYLWKGLRAISSAVLAVSRIFCTRNGGPLQTPGYAIDAIEDGEDELPPLGVGYEEHEVQSMLFNGKYSTRAALSTQATSPQHFHFIQQEIYILQAITMAFGKFGMASELLRPWKPC